jgi:hypothetical protein
MAVLIVIDAKNRVFPHNPQTPVIRRGPCPRLNWRAPVLSRRELELTARASQGGDLDAEKSAVPGLSAGSKH